MSRAKNTAASRKPRGVARRRAKAGGDAGESEIYELKITLRRTKPPIWRRFTVPGDITLAVLHDVIQLVMGWDDSHLHQFVAGNERRYSSGFLAEDDPEVVDATRVRLCDVANGVGARLRYEYDFGDGWDHRLEVVSVGPSTSGVEYPTCLAGRRSCPPEDCGGVYGYYNLLEIVADPTHEEHDERLEWLGGGIDPEAFDVEKVNNLLRSIR